MTYAELLDHPGYLTWVRVLRDHPDRAIVVADWIDEYGFHERAEFIRVQCELAKFPATITPGDRCPKCNAPGHWRRGVGFEHEKRCPKCELAWEPGGEPIPNPATESLRLREVQLRYTHREQWSYVPGYAPGYFSSQQSPEFNCGFMHKWSMDADSWLRSGDTIYRYHPVREVELTALDRESLRDEYLKMDDVAGHVRSARLFNADIWHDLYKHRWPGVAFALPPPFSPPPNRRYTAGLALQLQPGPAAEVRPGDSVYLGPTGESLYARAGDSTHLPIGTVVEVREGGRVIVRPTTPPPPDAPAE